MRSLVVVLAVALLAAGPVPVPAPAAAPEDGVRSLTGSWTCRHSDGELSRLTFEAEGAALVGRDVPLTPAARPWSAERFEPDGVGGWRVSSGTAGGLRFVASAAGWTGPRWDVDGIQHGAFGFSQPERISYERGEDASLRRVLAFGAEHEVFSGEVCVRGDAPPPPGLCAVRDVPATVVHAVLPAAPAFAISEGIHGRVEVLVSLDAQGTVVGAKIRNSPSAILNQTALAAAKGSTYRPALHDCVPVASTYQFSVEFTDR